MTVLEALSSINNTLKTITVSGEENLDKMLGCIRGLNSCISALNAPPKQEVEKNENSDPE